MLVALHVRIKSDIVNLALSIGLPPTVQPFATVQPFQTPTLDKIFLYGAFKRRAKGRYSGRRAQDTKALSRIGLLWLWLTLKGYGWLYRS